jgi:hypothetical protein
MFRCKMANIKRYIKTRKEGKFILFTSLGSDLTFTDTHTHTHIYIYIYIYGAWGSVVVKALRY